MVELIFLSMNRHVKHAIQLILFLLIASLPLEGFAGPVSPCPDMSAVMSASPVTMHQPAVHDMVAPIGSTLVGSAVSTMHQSDCHGNVGGAGCNPAAIPPTPVAMIAAPTTSVYASFDATLVPQLIPDLPRRPPRVL